jgi:hypothetical protein
MVMNKTFAVAAPVKNAPAKCAKKAPTPTTECQSPGMNKSAAC